VVAIRLDQTAKPPGIPGQAREDLDTGVAVTATAIGGPYLSYLWTLRDRAIDISVPVEASSALSASGASSTNITPIDVAGTYALRLAVDAGFGLGARAEDIADITFYAGPPLATVLGDFPIRMPAFSERAEHNVPDALQPSGNTDGWARTWLRWFYAIQQQSIVAAHVSLPPGGPAAILRSRGITSVTRNSQGICTVVMPARSSANYVVEATARGATGGHCTVHTATTTGFVIERADLGGALVDADFNFTVQLGS
jgi:hypothetical protein